MKDSKKATLRDGALWGYRLLLNREPADGEVDGLASSVRDSEGIRRVLTGSVEYRRQVGRAGVVTPPPAGPVDIAEGVRWAYLLLLRRVAGDDEIARDAAQCRGIADIQRRFLFSRDFELASPDLGTLASFAVLNRFAPFADAPVEKGAFRDFMGTTTRIDYLPAVYAVKSGKTESHPRKSKLHGVAEWVGTLRSVIEAGERLVAVELGAGWGPWLVGAAFAARKRGIADVALWGVEGDERHFAFMRDHFTSNGIDPDAHHLFHAVIGSEDGIARFPRLDVAREDYGANAVFTADGTSNRGALVEIRCIGLASLLARTGRVDIMHMDIQGDEEAVLGAAMAAMDAKVRRIVIGTHGRAIELGLLDLFSRHGWIVEHEQPCGLRQGHDGTIRLEVDGEQVWRNPRLQ